MSEIDPKISRVYREASSESPPAAVDAAILAAARKRAAGAGRRERSQRNARSLSFWSRWMVPASVAATLALGVSLALLVEREHPEVVDDTTIRQRPPRLQSPPPAPATEPAKAADSAAPAAKKEALAPAARSPVPAQPAQEPVSAAPAPVPAPVPVPAVPPQVPAPATPPKVSDFYMEKLAPVPPAPAPTLAPTPTPAAEAFPAERRAKASAPKAAEPGAAAPNAAAQDTGTVSNAAGDLATGRLDAPAAPAAPAAAAKPAPMRQQAIQRSPQVWLDEIGRLKRAGREREAAEQLAEFRKAYPAHVVPEELLK